MYTFDTNVLIYYAAGDQAIKQFIFEALDQGNRLYVPTIVIVEFLAFPAIKPVEETIFSDLLGQLSLVSLDGYTAFLAAKVRRQYRMKLGDSVVAATALATHSKLLTRNLDDFKKVQGLRVVEV